MKQNSLVKLGTYYFNFLLFGFPIQTFIPFLLGVNSTPFSIFFRVLYLCVSIILIFLPSQKSTFKLKIAFVSMLSFWVIYSIRLFFDMELMGIKYLDVSNFYVYSFAFGVCLIPAIATYKIANSFNIEKSLEASFLILLTSNLCSLYAILSFGNWDITNILLSRATVSVEIDGETLSLINPISIGFHGEVLALLSVFLIYFPIWKSKFYKTLVFASLALGILNILLGASRGPLLGFLLVLFFELYLIGKIKKFNISFIKQIVTFGGLVIFFLFFFLLNNVEEIELFNRTSIMYEERLSNVKEDRDYEWESAVNQFFKNPILGDAFVTDYDSSYSHNFFLDVLMSTGLVGGLLFFTFFIFLMLKVKQIVRLVKSHIFLYGYVIFFLVALIASMISGVG